MQSKVQTSDVETRHEFKARMADKIAQSLIPPVPQDQESIVEPVQVTVPVNFHTMSKYHLFGYLTHEGLTLEQANDVIDILNGTPHNGFNINLQGVHELKELQAECTLPEPPKSIKVELPHNFNNLRVQDRFLWLMKESHLSLSHAEANDVIDIAQGNNQVTGTQFTLTYAEVPVPEAQGFSHSVVDEIPQQKQKLTHFDVPEFPEGFETLNRVEQYRVLVDTVKLTPEHARFVLDTLQIPTQTEPVPVPEPKLIQVSLPFAFKGWVNKDQFAFLTKVKHLSTIDAEDVLGYYDGKQTLSTVVLDWEDVVDPEGRQSFKQSLLERIQNARIKKSVQAPAFNFNIPELPEGFSLLAGMEQFRVLTIDMKLTPEHAYAVLNSLKPEVAAAVVEPIALRQETISVAIPYAFKEWNAGDRFAFLTKTKHLSSFDANDVLAFCDGKQTMASIELTWEEIVDPEGRSSFKSRLAEHLEDVEVKDKTISAEVFSNDPVAERFEVIILPDTFPVFSDLDKYLYLNRTKGIPQETALRILDGAPEFKIEFVSAADAAQTGEYIQPSKPTNTISSKKSQVFVSLPPAFNSLKAGEQYWYLVKTKELSYAEANDLLALLSNKPQTGNIEFVVDWEE